MTDKNKPAKNSSEDMREHFKNHKLQRFAANIGLRLAARTFVLLRGGPGDFKKFKDPEQMTGLTEGAIIGERLCYPEKNTGLTYEQAKAGQWLGYDFNRYQAFGRDPRKETIKQAWEGRLGAFVLDAIKDQPPEARTPIGTLQIFSVEHVLSLDLCPADTLVDEGMIRRTTHAEAYARSGYENYIGELALRSVADAPVYQVTPKGNGLVLLLPDTGEQAPKRSAQPQFAWNPAVIGHS